jgi:hypothetical protein
MRLATMTLLTLILTLAARAGVAQVGGNVGYGQAGGRARAEQNERAKRQLTREEMPTTDTKCGLLARPARRSCGTEADRDLTAPRARELRRI